MRVFSLKYLLVVLGLGLAACETTKVAPIAVSERPDEASDEAGLWLQMDSSEKLLQASALVERDPALNAYVQSVVCKVAREYCDDLRVYVVKQPYFNANMAPNGQMQVWTGLLLRAQNEAQLAFVIGHEFAHYRQRHSLQQWREIKNAANASMAFSFGVAAAGVPEAAVLGDFSIAARIYGFGRDKEREADELGFRFTTDAGYDGREAAEIWKYLIAEVENSDRKANRRRIARTSIFSTHPVTSERVEYLSEYAAARTETGVTNEDEFSQVVAPFIGQWLDDDLVKRDFGQTIFLINRLMQREEQLGTLYFRRGEAYRLRRQEGDDERALADYTKATSFEDTPPAAWREIGNMQMKAGERAEASMAFNNYLAAAPDAADRELVTSYLRTLEGEDE